MANEFRHTDSGTRLTAATDEGVVRHIANNQQANDMLYFNGTYWIRATPATIAALLDHGTLSGLDDADHDAVYFQESEFKNSSAGAGDAGKPIKLDAGGKVDATMVNDADIDHGTVGGLTDDDHTQYVKKATLTTEGDLLVRGASVPERFAKPATGKLLKATATGYEGVDETSQKVVDAVVTDFQAYAATGTSTSPERVNNNDTGTSSTFDSIGEYAIVEFRKVVNIKRWRMFGNVDDNGSGRYKFWYWNLATRAWVEWTTGIPTRATADWSTLATLTAVVTSMFKIECTTVDTGNSRSQCAELEVYY